MEKRSWYGTPEADPKRSKVASDEDAGGDGAFMTPLEAEFYMEQRLVGWIIGRSGGTLKEIEQAYNCKVVVDQSSKDLGYSKVRISGAAVQVQQAAEHMNASLARASASSADAGATSVGPFLLDSPPGNVPDPMYEDMHIEQRFVGWLLGKGGGVVREIETGSGCKISINQDTRNLGFSKAQIHGTAAQRQVARQMIEESLQRARATGDGGRIATEELQIEQKWVGWLLGKGGGVAKEIEHDTGCKVSIDQSTKGAGYSTVKIVGEMAQVEAAKMRVLQSLEKVGALPLATTSAASSGSTQLQVEQQWVGWLLGKSGSVMKEIEAATGAAVSINQDTKALGYSTATINGNPTQIQFAVDIITDKLKQVAGDSGGATVIAPAQGSAIVQVGQAGQAGRRPPLVLPNREAGHGPIVIGGRKPQLSLMPRHDPVQAIDIQIEQKWIGWLLGCGGKTIREIEQETGTKISINQETKELGYSIARVEGTATATHLAQKRIEASVSLVCPGATGTSGPEVATGGKGGGPPIDGAGDMQVEQKYVGWLLGKSGIVLKEMEAQSGARIMIDQSTKELGYSTVHISGDMQYKMVARRLIEDKIVQAGGGHTT